MSFRLRPLLSFVAVMAFLTAGAAAAHYFDLPIAATSTTGLFKNLRTTDGRLNNLDLTTNPQIGEITLLDGTGETITTPTTAAPIKSATLTLVGLTRGAVTGTAADGSLTLRVPGLYRAIACMGDGVGDNTATTTLTIFRKDGSGAAATLGKGANAVAVNTTANIWHPMCAQSLFSVSVAQALATVIIDGRITASTGSPEVKAYTLEVMKVDELQPAAP